MVGKKAPRGRAPKAEPVSPRAQAAKTDVSAATPAVKKPSVTKTARAPKAVLKAETARTSVVDEVTRVKVELDRANLHLRRLLRELDERGPNSPSVPQIWESVRQAATASDQLIQRLERLRSESAPDQT